MAGGKFGEDNSNISEPEQLDEALKPFADRQTKTNAIKMARRRGGEGIEDGSNMAGAYGVFGTTDVKGYNTFYKKFIDNAVKNEQEKIMQYRNIARYPEIAEVLEDVVGESTQTDSTGNVIRLSITDADVQSNTNIAKALIDEFYKIFYNRIQIQKKIDDLLLTYYTDGRVFGENLIDIGKPKLGIIGIKKLATETMDYSGNPYTGKFNFFVQYMKLGSRMPVTFEEALADKQNVIPFHAKQVSFLDYGIYGPAGRKDILGYLEKVKQPYNQLKLLETSIVIYRLVRAPERLVFKIDTGSMPLDRAMKYVEQVKKSLQQKVFYDPQSGNLSNQPNVLSILENFFLPQSAGGRGSSIDSIGGNPSGFSELDDLQYFQKKLYRSLKYPMSRVEHIFEQEAKEIRFADSSGEIARDETKGGRFLKKHQDKFCEAFLDLFMLHMEFTGFSEEYGIKRNMLKVHMTVPNDYIGQMGQQEFQRKGDNYRNTEFPEFSKYWRMKRILKMSDSEIEENIKMFELDKVKGLTPSDEVF